MNFRNTSRLALAMAPLLAVLAGCGQKGPLLRPESDAQSPVVIRPAPATPAPPQP